MSSITEDVQELATAIADAVEAKLAQRPRYLCELQPERYSLDHAWTLARRKKEEAKIRFWNDLSLHLAKWSLLGILGFLLVLTANGARQWLQRWLGG